MKSLVAVIGFVGSLALFAIAAETVRTLGWCFDAAPTFGVCLAAFSAAGVFRFALEKESEAERRKEG